LNTLNLPEPSPSTTATALAPGVSVKREGLRLQFSRGGGPGGQNVNKLNTAVQAWIRLDQITGMSPPALQRLRAMAGNRLTTADELYIRAQTHRTQQGNLADVLERVRQLIVAAQVQPKRRRKTRPSAAARQRRLDSKRRRALLKARRRGKI
jgi:ribosome-associated protein